MDFEIIGDIRYPETFARSSCIRELPRLRKIYGQGLWRKRKGFATVRLLQDGTLREAEFIGMTLRVLASGNLKLNAILTCNHE